MKLAEFYFTGFIEQESRNQLLERSAKSFSTRSGRGEEEDEEEAKNEELKRKSRKTTKEKDGKTGENEKELKSYDMKIDCENLRQPRRKSKKTKKKQKVELRIINRRRKKRKKKREFMFRMFATFALLLCSSLAINWLPQLVAEAESLETGSSRGINSQSNITGKRVSRRNSNSEIEGNQVSAPTSSLGKPTSSSIRNVTAQNGQSVLLHCPVEPPGESSGVSWFRGAGEPQLLTYESNTVIDDERFVVRHGLVGTDDWALQIKNLDKATDSGLYQCQTHAEPPRSFFYQLNIVEPQVHILGAPDMAVKLGAAINLTCVISQSPDQLQFIFWYRDGHVINYEINDRGKIVISKWPHRLDTITSNLQISHSKLSDSGNYTCMPPGARPMSIQVHVLEGSDKRLIMFQNDYEHESAASSQQQTSSAISVHVVRLSKGRVYALFVAFLIFASWYQLVAQTQTAISLLLLAIIGFFLEKLTNQKQERGQGIETNSSTFDGRAKSQLLKDDLTLRNENNHFNGSTTKLADTLQPLIISRHHQQGRPRALSGSSSTGADSSVGTTMTSSADDDERRTSSPSSPSARLISNSQATQSNSQQHTSSPASSSASTGYNSDSRSINNTTTTQPAAAEMIELVSQPTALHLIMDEFSASRERVKPARPSEFASATANFLPSASPSSPAGVTPVKPLRAEQLAGKKESQASQQNFGSFNYIWPNSHSTLTSSLQQQQQQQQEPHYSSPALVSYNSMLLRPLHIPPSSPSISDDDKQQHSPPSCACDCP